jgi:hypothetical protein
VAINGGSLSSTSTPALSNSTAATLCQVPPGVGVVIISNNSGATVYVTAGVTATTTNGFAIPTGAPPVTIPTYPGSKGTALSVIAGTAPTASAPVSWLISSAQ